MAQALAEKLEQTGPAKKEGWSQHHKVSCWQGCRSHLCQKENEQSHQSRSPDLEMEDRVKVSKSYILVRKRKVRAVAWRGKNRLCSEGMWISRRRGRAGKENLCRRRRKHEWMQKFSRSVWRVPVSFQVPPNLKWGRRLGDKRPAHKVTRQNKSG